MKNVSEETLIEPHRAAISELKEFLGVKELKYKNRVESANAVADYFRNMNPKTESEYNLFYETCNDYVFENVYCNSENSCIQRTKKIYEVFKNNHFDNVLEIGAGIGTYSICMSKYVDSISVLESSDLASEFFLYRVKNRKITNINFVNKIENKYDCIFFIDVIEHIKDPIVFLQDIILHTDAILFTHGFRIHTEKFGGYPQHFDHSISKIKLFLENNGFVKQKVNCIFPPHFYKRRNLNEKNRGL